MRGRPRGSTEGTSGQRSDKHFRFFACAAIATAVCAAAGDANADDCEPVDGFSPCIDVDNLWVRPGSSSFLAIGSSLTTPPGQVAFGVVVGYQRRPFRLLAFGPSIEPRDIYVIENALDVTYTFALGITDRLEIGVAAPVTFYQDGAGYEVLSGSGEVLSRSVVRDPRLGVTVDFVARERREAAQGLALTGRFELAAPLGNGEAFAGARGATFVPALTASYVIGPFEGAAEVAGRIRGEESLGNDVWGSQIVAMVGASVLVWAPIRLSVAAEAFAMPVLATQSEENGALVPSEWLASVRSAPFLAGDIFFQVGGGSSIPLTAFATTSPEFRFVGSGGYAPRANDSDTDGVLDRDDQCAGAREDRDGFKDDDGCPDPDNDEDRILDAQDRCRDEAETVDGFKDDDGCPDLDDDGDGIPDEEDSCRNDPEDKDGVQDVDGCPDLDDDADGIPDAKDGCPNNAEDKDGFKDEDGCPDLDNDADGIPDTTDQCPMGREDKDGFADEDGCPDPDNDADGILDGADKCATDPETLDGKDDDDGCPEAGAKSIVELDLARGHFTIAKPAIFKPKSADPTPELALRVRLIARLVRSRGVPMTVIVEAYADKQSDAGGEALAIKRAAAVRRILREEGIPDERITAASGDPTLKRAADAPQIDVTIVRPSEP